jgi:tRNA (adenine-N(1)-)-methyltransferase non-catalytic subunit
VAPLRTLIGKAYGAVLAFEERTKEFVPSPLHPDLDVTDISTEFRESKDNRDLDDTRENQTLTHQEVMAAKAALGAGGIVDHLVEKSATFQSKTAFSQEKYIRKKKTKYVVLFKVDRVTPETLAELHFPTVSVSDEPPEESKFLRLRADTLALIVHHANIHDDSRVLCYDRTNGLLQAAILHRLAADGRVYHLMDRKAQPNTVYASMMQIPHIKERWRAVPRNVGFLRGAADDDEERPKPSSAESVLGGDVTSSTIKHGVGPTQWMRGVDAREELLRSPADCLVIVDDEDPTQAVRDLLPFVALSGNIVVYSPYLEALTQLFPQLRNDAVCVRISETWYRHHQVLPGRTHPTVNMNTAGGYLLTAVRVERNDLPARRFNTARDCVGARVASKRLREEPL